MNSERSSSACSRAWQKLLVISLGSLTLMVMLLWGPVASAQEPALVPEAPGSISGVVTNEEGTPLAGIEVVVYQGQLGGWQALRTLSTDANGAYRAAVLATGNYRLRFRDPQGRYAQEFNDNALTLASAADIAIAGNDVQGVNARLAPGGAISGQVTFTGTLLGFFLAPTATVQLLSNSNGQWQEVVTTTARPPTDAYSLTQLPVGNYRVCAAVFYPLFPQSRWQECYDNVASGVDNAQDVAVVAAQTTANINLRLGDQADLAVLGGVVTAADGKPLPGLAVTIYRADQAPVATVTTNQAGSYQVTGLPPGDYTVKFTDPSGPYLTQYYKNAYVPELATPVALQANDRKLDVNISLALGAQLVGTVLLDSQTPATNATVQILDASNVISAVRTVGVDPLTGAYRSGGLFPGDYKVLASVVLDGNRTLNGYFGGRDLAQAQNVTVGASETRSDINIVVGEGAFEGSISGLVTNLDGQPLAGIRVGLLRSDPKVTPIDSSLLYRTTTPDGRYSIGGLVDGPYWLLFSDPAGVYAATYHEGRGVVENPAPLTVVGGQTNANTVVLQRGGAISGRVSQRNGTGVTGAQVTLFASVGDQPLPISVQASGNGTYKITGIPPGLYRLCATHGQLVGRCYDGGALASATPVAVVAGGEVQNVDIVIGVSVPRLVYLPLVGR